MPSPQHTRWSAVRVVAAARALSTLGSSLTIFALVLREKDQGAAIVALLFAFGTIPLILLAPWAGLLADRHPTRRVVPIASSLQAILVASLVIDSPIWLVLLTIFLATAAGTVVAPAWAALIPDLTTTEDLPRAMGLTQSLFALAGLLAPALGGFLVATTGFIWPFIIDAATFIVVALTPYLAGVNRRPTSPDGIGSRGAFDGIRFLFEHRLLRAIVILLTAFIIALGVINVGEVFLITDVLGGSAVIYGLAGSLFAGGMLLGGMVTATRRVAPERFALMVVLALVIMGAAALGISLAWHWGMVLPLLFAMGIGNAILQAYASTIIIGQTPEQIRGRVMAGISGVINVGSVAALGIGGVAIGMFTVRPTLIGGSVAALIALVIFAPAVLRAGSEPAGSERERQPA